MYTLEEFLQNKTWNPTIEDGPDGRKVLFLRLQMKPGTTVDHLRITLDGFDLRVEVNNSVTTAVAGQISKDILRSILIPLMGVFQVNKVIIKSLSFQHVTSINCDRF